MEIGLRAAKPEPDEASLVQQASTLPEPGDVRAPRRDGVVDVETGHGGELPPETVDIRLAEHAPRPALGRACDDRPRVREPRCLVDLDLPPAPWRRTSRTGRLHVREEIGIGVAERQDGRRALRAECRRLDERRRAVERALGRVNGVQAADVLVEVEAFDVTGPGPPPGLGERAEQRGVLRLPDEDEFLPRLDVRADTHRELRVPRHEVHRGDHLAPGVPGQASSPRRNASSRESQTGSYPIRR